MKRKRKRTPEERAELARLEAHFAETSRLLEERIAYHRAKLKEEHGPEYEPPTLDEYVSGLPRKHGAS